MNTQSKTFLVAVAVTVAGCGGGSSEMTAAAPPPVDTTPPSVQSSSPEDNAGPVSVAANPSATFSEALDPNTVNSMTFKLADSSGVQVRGAVNYDDTNNSVTFIPAEALTEGVTFTASVDGVADIAGNTAAPTTITFTTFRVPLLQRLSYRDGVIIGQTDYENNTDGALVRVIRRADAGVDGVWNTGDELPRDVMVYERNADGAQTARLSFGDPGVDGLWLTADDTLTLRQTFEIGTNGLPSRDVRWLAGPDGVLNTSDDEPREYLDFSYNAFGAVVVQSRFRTPGVDGVWFTEDDDPDRAAIVREYDDKGLLVLNTEILRGPDNTIGSDDDIVEEYFEVSTNEEEMRVELISYSGSGADEEWFTDDDEIRNYQLRPFDAQGRETGFIRGSGPGADNIWLTDDDDYRLPSQSFNYDDSDSSVAVITTFSYSELGTDNTPFTADDVIASIRVQSRLDKSLVSSDVTYNDAGVDETWQTTDDIVSLYEVIERDASLNILTQRAYGNSGPDGVIATPDDELIGESIYDVPR
ncbi:MAG: Ig-like domain-containing protein [Gammaproteobacteria bacterium]